MRNSLNCDICTCKYCMVTSELIPGSINGQTYNSSKHQNLEHINHLSVDSVENVELKQIIELKMTMMFNLKFSLFLFLLVLSLFGSISCFSFLPIFYCFLL